LTARCDNPPIIDFDRMSVKVSSMSTRNTFIALGVVLAAMWFTTDFAIDLMQIGFDHEGAIILWGITGTVIWHLRDE
jgi:hypothetical protein